ncbi:MAG TPA: alkaline phosphatase family protein [Verrucomicrobiales bacterium]|nr:alkaline phosphatase family protein [Verrucomicrobiales bacterium]
MSQRKLFLIGWDAADWKAITPLLDAGKMPNLERLVNEGVMGNLATLHPPLSPMLWTSIATGKRPYKHGIYGFSEPDPATGGIRPITNLSRKTKALWNILSQNNLRSNVVGWWPSHPAEPIRGAMVSNFYQRAEAPVGKPWRMRPGTIHPARLKEELAALRLHPAEVDPEVLQLFVPEAAEVDQKNDRRLENLARIIADTVGIHNAATWLLQNEPWDFMAVYYDAIDHFGHGFMKYHPPRREWISEQDFRLYSQVIEGAYRYHDLMLGVLMHLAGEDTSIMLISDHGFHPDALRPDRIPIEPAGPAAEHSPFGIFVWRGPQIRADERIFGATLLDVAPTILHHFGLPVGRDMDGKVLVQAHVTARPPETVESWDLIDGESGRHPPDMALDASEANELLHHLVDLGYIEEPDEDREKARQRTVNELQYNLARSCMDGGRHKEAERIFRHLWEAEPREHRYGVGLFNSLLALSRNAEAREVLETVMENKKKFAGEAMVALRDFREAHNEIERKDWSRKEQLELRRLTAESSVNPASLALLEGRLLLQEGHYAAAIRRLEQAGERMNSESRITILNLLAYARIRSRDLSGAIRDFQKVVELDPSNATAHAGLAQCYLRRERFRKAADAAINATTLLYFQPQTHYHLGMALQRLGRWENAVQAFKVAVSQSPALPDAHRRLARIYAGPLNQPEKAGEHRERFRSSKTLLRSLRRGRYATAERDLEANPAAESEADSVLDGEPEGQRAELPVLPPFAIGESVQIVTGLPRAGTSMLMQMLVAGGLEPLRDDQRPPDENNPRGYFELSKIKGLARDAAWLGPEGRGKVVKIVAPLIPLLPRDLRCQVVFIHRNLDEIVASQQAMLQRLGRSGAGLDAHRLKWNLRQQVLQARRRLHTLDQARVLDLRHAQVLADPAGVAKQLAAFFGCGLQESEMAQAVDGSLYRIRAAEGETS